MLRYYLFHNKFLVKFRKISKALEKSEIDPIYNEYIYLRNESYLFLNYYQIIHAQ